MFFLTYDFEMKANPGGQIDTKAVVGRDQLVGTIWETLAQQSVVITAERRIGKTTVIKVMAEAPAAGWIPVYQDLERCHTAPQFAEVVYRDVHRFLTSRGKAARRAIECMKALGGIEIGGILKLPEGKASSWKDVLTRTIEDLIQEHEASDTRLLFLWDEVPFMLANIRDREGEEAAMEVLDLLRALRQTHGSLRMVITGSIGLHHVLSSLKEKNYSNSPVNDMMAIDVPPLDEGDAVRLALLLIEGERLNAQDPGSTAKSVAREADAFPFYIHHIVKALKMRGFDANPDSVCEVVSSQLVDANDPWELLHYRERIPIYYGKDEKTVLLLLDELALSGTRSVNELLRMLSAASEFDDRERLLRLLSLMERDHYLKRDREGSYHFRFPLIRRWWNINRGL